MKRQARASSRRAHDQEITAGAAAGPDVRSAWAWRSYDPFYGFEKAARDDGKPLESPEPKAERALLALLGSNAVLVVMGGVLAVVLAILLVVLVVKG